MNDFDIFWSHYPRKKEKAYARKCWNKQKKAKILPDIEIVIKAVETQKKEKEYLKNQNKFVPEWKNPSTWLNRECWEDECELPKAAPQKQERKSNPLADMNHAYQILVQTRDKDKFKDFANAVGMSNEDREAVLNKYLNRFNVHNLAKGIFA